MDKKQMLATIELWEKVCDMTLFDREKYRDSFSGVFRYRPLTELG